jgi:hypothetical protein
MTHENAENVIHRVPTYKIWANAESTVLVRMWASGNVEVSLRDEPGAIWGPPIKMEEER